MSLLFAIFWIKESNVFPSKRKNLWSKWATIKFQVHTRILKQNDGEQISKRPDLQAKIFSLEERLENLTITHKTSVRSLQTEIDNTNQHERRDTLILSGRRILEVTADENTKQIVQDLFRPVFTHTLVFIRQI